MLYLTESDVRQLLPMPEAVRIVRSAFEELAAGVAINQPRRRLILPTGSVLHYMVAGDGKYFGGKIYSTNPKHGAHFLFLLYRAEDGQPLAIFEANYLGQIRTGAASGLATDVMARTDAETVGVIGSGFQARSQLEAVAAVRHIRAAKVWSRNEGKRTAFAVESSKLLELPVEAVQTAEEAVRGADIVITATNSREPVLEDGWISAGTHINAMGSNQAKRRELPSELVRRADWIAMDSREQSLMEAGDLLMALDQTDWNSPRIVELKDIIAGTVVVRTNPREVTLFKSNGLAIEDVVSAGYAYERAIQIGLGRTMSSLYS